MSGRWLFCKRLFLNPDISKWRKVFRAPTFRGAHCTVNDVNDGGLGVHYGRSGSSDGDEDPVDDG